VHYHFEEISSALKAVKVWLRHSFLPHKHATAVTAESCRFL